AGDIGHPAALADIPELVVSEPRIPLGAAEVEPACARAAQLVDRGPAQRIARAQGERLVARRAERNEDAIPGADDDGADHRLALMAREEEAHAELLARLFGDRGQILDAVMIVELLAREHVLVERNKIRNAVLEAGLFDDEFVRYLFQIRAPLRAERSELLFFRKREIDEIALAIGKRGMKGKIRALHRINPVMIGIGGRQHAHDEAALLAEFALQRFERSEKNIGIGAFSFPPPQRPELHISEPNAEH